MFSLLALTLDLSLSLSFSHITVKKANNDEIENIICLLNVALTTKCSYVIISVYRK